MATDLQDPEQDDIETSQKEGGQATGDANPDQPSGGAFARAILWCKNNWIVASGAGFIAMIVLGVAYMMFVPKSKPPPTIEAAEKAFDVKAYSQAREIALELIKQDIMTEGVAPSIPAYIAGAATFGLAETAVPTDRRDMYLEAAGYLEEAREIGLPKDREGDGLLMLGESLYLSGQPEASRAVFKAAIKKAPRLASQCYWYLAESYINAVTPDFDAAQQENENYLAVKQLSPRQRADGHLQKARIELLRGEPELCQETIESLDIPDVDRAQQMLIQGEYHYQMGRRIKQEGIDWTEAVRQQELLNRSTSGNGGSTEPVTPPEPPKDFRKLAIENFEKAIREFTEVGLLDHHASVKSRTAFFLCGMSYLELGDSANIAKAREQFADLRDLFPASSEAAAAEFMNAEIARHYGESEEALAGYQRSLDQLRKLDRYVNPWLPVSELRKHLKEAFDDYRQAKQFQAALDMADMLSPIFSEVEVASLKAQTAEAWANDCLDQLNMVAPSERAALRREAKQHFTQAGDFYTELAKQEYLTRNYTEDLWQAAECYRKAGNFPANVQMLQWYLKYEIQLRQPVALLYLGESLTNLGQYSKALEVLNECMDFYPDDPTTYRARLTAARANVEKGDMAEAERLLEENLYGILAPSSNEYRDSLFELGFLMSKLGRTKDAIARLQRAVDRYTDAPQTPEARYLLALNFLQENEDRRQNFVDTDSIDVQKHRMQQDRENIEAALEQYTLVRDELVSRQEMIDELPPNQAGMLRNSYIAIGSLLMDLDRYEEAVAAYLVAASQYQNSPNKLIIYLELARAYREMGKPREARNAVQQLKMLFTLLRDSGEFTGTPDMSLEEWQEMIDWQEQL